jgi:predicted membrane channel-forming protein YqfA (hemolysin III family)
LTLFQLPITNKQNTKNTKKNKKQKQKQKQKKQNTHLLIWIHFILSITSLRLSIYKTNKMLANKDIDLKR